MILNTAKSSTITFTLQKVITSEPIKIQDELIEESTTVKLLGVYYDQHLRFSKHVAAAIDKSKSAFHAIVTLKKAGVKPHSLAQVYRARVWSIISCAAAAWYPFISAHDKEMLEKYQRLCLRVIFHHLENYNERLT